MPQHTDRFGRTIEQTSTEEGEVFAIPGAGTMTLRAGTSWVEAQERVEALGPPAEVDPVPESIPGWKAKIALHQAGLLEAAQAAIAGAGLVAQIAFSEAPEWARRGPLLEGMAASLGLTDDQVDDLFRAAAAITV